MIDYGEQIKDINVKGHKTYLLENSVSLQTDVQRSVHPYLLSHPLYSYLCNWVSSRGPAPGFLTAAPRIVQLIWSISVCVCVGGGSGKQSQILLWCKRMHCLINMFSLKGSCLLVWASGSFCHGYPSQPLVVLSCFGGYFIAVVYSFSPFVF